MRGSRKRSELNHDDTSYWAGPGLIRIVCKRCGRVSVDLSEHPAFPDLDPDLAVDSFSWMTGAAVG